MTVVLCDSSRVVGKLGSGESWEPSGINNFGCRGCVTGQIAPQDSAEKLALRREAVVQHMSGSVMLNS